MKEPINKWQLNIVFLVFLFALAHSAYAIDPANIPIPDQVPDLQEQVQSTMEPQYPHPGDEVKITLEAYGTDLDNASIVWAVNGQVSSHGLGQKTFTVTAGKVGVTTTVTAVILPVDGNPVTQVFYVNPQSVDIIWEAHTYTPPFYEGKAMYTAQEKLSIVAMPDIVDADGSTVDPKAVSYKWRQDNVVQGSLSGYGVQAYSYTGNILLQPVDFDVEASIADGDTAENYITINPTSPSLDVYEDSPLYGILFNKELSGGFDFGTEAERSVAAVPYFFGVQNRADADLSYDWSINGSPISVPTTQNEMTFRNTTDQEGQSVVGINVNNTANFLQSASGGTTINFKKPAKTFSF